MRFTIATYNIHKGFTQLNRRMVIHELRERLHGLSVDILFLQEVVGVHRGHAARGRLAEDSPTRVTCGHLLEGSRVRQECDPPPWPPRQRPSIAISYSRA